MSRVANFRPVEQKPERESKDPARKAAVANMPCVICHEFGMQQLSQTKVHHCIHNRGGTRRAADSKTIPLCDGHHQGKFDTSKVALHREPTEWKRLYGLDTDYLDWVKERL